ncbi:MAG: hypothetical protein KatS3mg090_0611 [Patescibacteria group bacterium]|nr:MAG: hypothetical protein KatS3mg090_0611 [Patescibacteria group bacterium]
MKKITWRKDLSIIDNLTEDLVVKELIRLRDLQDLTDEEFYDTDLNTLGFSNELAILLDLLSFVKKKKKKIVVYTDYDADGITGGAIMWESLYLLGFDVMPYVPDRKTEGYGFSVGGLDYVKKTYDPGLIISVDHGISAREKIEYAKTKLGIPIVVTDHHLKPKLLPESAEAIIHMDFLSGSGVSFFTAKSIVRKLAKNNDNEINKNFQVDYTVLASIGTVADLVPLIGLSRQLVKKGLVNFSKSNRVGLRQLLKNAGIDNKKISPYDIGFIIAPRINAAGRLESALTALQLLCTKSPERASVLASKLSQLNSDRQDLVEEFFKQIEQKYSSLPKLPKIILEYSPDLQEGIIGLIASRLVERFNRPSIVFTDSDGFIKASARSVEDLHITNFLRKSGDLLVEVGGHKQAAGLKVSKENFADLKLFLNNLADKEVTDNMLVKKITADFKVRLDQLSEDLYFKLLSLEPFGVGNPKPSFYSKVRVVSARLFGKNNEHTKLTVSDGFGQIDLLAFRNERLFFKVHRDEQIHVVFNLAVDRWNNRTCLNGMLIDYSLAG